MNDMEKEEKIRLLNAWKESHIQSLIKRLAPSGEVLEVGFDSGNAANQIQIYAPKNHIIIEPDAKKAEEARLFAKKHPSVSVIEDSWKYALPMLGMFDAIFFHESLADHEIQMIRCLSKEQLIATATQAKEVLKTVEEKFNQIKVKFSDIDIDHFFEDIGQYHVPNMIKFLEILKGKGNISESQYGQTIKKYRLATIQQNERRKSKESLEDPLLAFLDVCLKYHMRNGARFSWFSLNPASKYEDPQFFEKVITNPDLDYQEDKLPIELPGFSTYYSFTESMIPLIEKRNF